MSDASAPATADPAINSPTDRFPSRLQRGVFRFIFPGIWLIYLAQTVAGVGKHSHGAAAVVGYLLIVAFGLAYLLALPQGWGGNRRVFWALYATMIVLCGLEAVFAHEDAFVMCVYIAVLTIASGPRWGVPGIIVLTAIATFLPPLIPSWHTGVDTTMTLTIPLVGLAMYGFFGIIRSNIQLAEARSEVARLAAENERSRIARDLHDLLGHSLTTITVKAGLARRLAERDPARAAREIGEVEELSRRSLADVRAAVDGYRDVTLAGELASAREVLRAAGIEACLPGAVDSVPSARHELFGWVLREAITNVVRHSRARKCTVTVGPTWIEIVDDGDEGPVLVGGAGNGLTGLRERVAAAGGVAQVCPGPDRGWRVRVDVPLGPKCDPAEADFRRAVFGDLR